MSEYEILVIGLVFTIIYTTASIIAIWLAIRQIKLNLEISNKEKSLDAYVDFSDKYAKISRLSHEMEARFETGDKTLKAYDIKYFFNSFWVLQLQEWEFFQARIIPVRIFAQWMMHCHEYLMSETSKSYFDAKGEVVTISTKQGFEQYGRRVLRFHPDFIAFIAKLEAIPYRGPHDSKATYGQVEALVRSYAKDATYWKI